MRKSAFVFVVVCACFAVFASVFADSNQAQKPERPVVPTVDKSETVAVSRVLIKIPYGTKVAKVTGTGYSNEIEWTASTIKDLEQFKEVATAALENYGYKTIEEDLFQSSTSAKARFQIGSIINKFLAEYAYSGGGCFGPAVSESSKINLNAEFQLYDSVQDKVVFKATEQGYYENAKDSSSLEKLLVSGYEDAFLRFMAEPQFVETVSGQKPKTETPAGK